MSAAFSALSSTARGASHKFAGHEEPSLAEMIEDPIVRRLLASDGVRRETLMAMIVEMKAKLIG
jgi:hypothetical protein